MGHDTRNCLKKMTQITENDVMLNDKQNNVPLPKKITQITENDVTLKNKNNDVMLINEENDFPLP